MVSISMTPNDILCVFPFVLTAIVMGGTFAYYASMSQKELSPSSARIRGILWYSVVSVAGIVLTGVIIQASFSYREMAIRNYCFIAAFLCFILPIYAAFGFCAYLTPESWQVFMKNVHKTKRRFVGNRDEEQI